MTNPYESPQVKEDHEETTSDDSRQKLYGTHFFIKCLAAAGFVFALFSIIRFGMFFLFYWNEYTVIGPVFFLGEIWRAISAVFYAGIAYVAWRYANAIKRAVLAKELDLAESIGWQNSLWYGLFVFMILSVLVSLGFFVYGFAAAGLPGRDF